MEKELKFSDGLRRSLEGSNKKYPLHNYLQQKSELARTQEILRNIEARNEKGKWLAHFRLKEKELLEALKNAPPDPVLPPPAPLIKVSGVVTNYHQRCLTHYFDTKAYPQTWEYFSRQDENMASAAMVLASTGSAATAQGMVASNEDRVPSSAWYVTGEINGRPFSGWLGAPYCREGEEVELIAAPVGEEYLVYALVRPHARSLTMPPWCYQGIRRARIDAMKVPISVVILLIIMMLIVFIYQDGWVVTEKIVSGVTMFLTMGTFLYILPAIWTIWRRHPFPKEQLTEEILTVAGWENVTNIDLLKHDKKKIKEFKKQGRSIRLLKSGWWFYYY
ncbi:putative type VI secretion system effector [Citrobacter meridianamericanus]|uniref:putative type VI secretion system effector n=1 Tax=Citrobacter meridianamericanus TaxID=2894201 RepID=UPI0039BDD4F8